MPAFQMAPRNPHRQILILLKRRELVTTETELIAIAAEAMIGLSKIPIKG
ncbi:MAG: hypothetical protein JRH09_18605 [Deltaproteobacteria bacterium]|nr:hypothetical protein [Deltaproteobacteria bacterium]